MQQTIETLAVRVDKIESDVSELQEKANGSAVVQATINEKLNNILISLGELKEGLKGLQQQPVKRLDTIIGTIITALVAGVIGYFLSRIK